eukprot:m.173457 g.173457  ORF g.173457 m.173457 type:complete len:664 (+) comp16737_c0_seq1:1648-3639(+)
MTTLEAVILVYKDTFSPARLLFWYPRSIELNESNQHTTTVANDGFEYDVRYGLPPTPSNTTAPTQHREQHPADDFANSFSLSASSLADVLSPSFEVADGSFEIRLDNQHFVGHSQLVQAYGETDPTAQFLYNVVFVLSLQAAPATRRAYQALAYRLSNSLAHEERRAGHLSKDIKVMSDIIDKASLMLSKKESHVNALSELLNNSKAARSLQEVFLQMKELGRCHLKINGWVGVSHCTTADDLPEFTHFALNGSRIKQIRPYHTLLLRTTPQQLKKRLPNDCNSALRRLVEQASPLKTFEDLAQDINVSLTQVLRLALHLVAWFEAKVIHPVCGSSVLLITDTLDRRRLDPTTWTDFTSSFPKHTLANILERFSRPRSLEEHLGVLSRDEQKDRLRIIQWLLQREMIQAVHTYVLLLLPEPTSSQHNVFDSEQDSDTAASNFEDDTCDDSEDNSFALDQTICPDPSPLPAAQSESLDGPDTDLHDEASSPVLSHAVDIGNPDASNDPEAFVSPPNNAAIPDIADNLDNRTTPEDDDTTPKAVEVPVAIPQSTPLVHTERVLEILSTSVDDPHVIAASKVAEEDVSVDDSWEQLELPFDKPIVKLLREAPGAEDPTIWSDFVRLHSYFDGRHSIEEMMWRENVDRATIFTVLDTFHRVVERLVW